MGRAKARREETAVTHSLDIKCETWNCGTKHANTTDLQTGVNRKTKTRQSMYV